MNLFIRPAAVADLHAARKYYEEARPGLGEELADDSDRLFARLLVFPLSAPVVERYEPVRRARLRRFPYQVFYRADDDRIDILWIVHIARTPETWRTTTQPSDSAHPYREGSPAISRRGSHADTSAPRASFKVTPGKADGQAKGDPVQPDQLPLPATSTTSLGRTR